MALIHTIFISFPPFKLLLNLQSPVSWSPLLYEAPPSHFQGSLLSRCRLASPKILTWCLGSLTRNSVAFWCLSGQSGDPLDAPCPAADLAPRSTPYRCAEGHQVSQRIKGNFQNHPSGTGLPKTGTRRGPIQINVCECLCVYTCENMCMVVCAYTCKCM